MRTLYLNRKAFLKFYFSGISFNDNVYVGLLYDGKYEVNLDELLLSVSYIPQWVLEHNQEFEILDDENVNIENVILKIN